MKMKVNYYGCDRFNQGLYTDRFDLSCDRPPCARELRTAYGTFRMWDCTDPAPRPVESTLYFASYTLLCAWIILSLFISVITMGMFEALEELEMSEDAEQYESEMGGGIQRQEGSTADCGRSPEGRHGEALRGRQGRRDRQGGRRGVSAGTGMR